MIGGDPTRERATGPSDAECSAAVPPLADQRVPEEKARLILVVRAAAQLNVVGGGWASRRVRRDVMELKEGDLAASARAPDEPAASLIALPDCAPDRRRYVTSRWQYSRPSSAAVRRHGQTCAARDGRSAASMRDR